MSKSLALNQSNLKSASPQDREMALVDAFNRALVAASETNDVAVKAQIVQDARALSAMAAAYRVSEETKRKVGEASIRLQRSFGASLMATYPNASGSEMGAKTGVAGINCTRAVRLAKYDDAALESAFSMMREQGRSVGIEITLKYLLENDPAYRQQLEERWQRQRESYERAQRAREADPDYELLQQIWSKTGHNYWNACQEILRLSRQVVELRAEIQRRRGAA